MWNFRGVAWMIPSDSKMWYSSNRISRSSFRQLSSISNAKLGHLEGGCRSKKPPCYIDMYILNVYVYIYISYYIRVYSIHMFIFVSRLQGSLLASLWHQNEFPQNTSWIQVPSSKDLLPPNAVETKRLFLKPSIARSAGFWDNLPPQKKQTPLSLIDESPLWIPMEIQHHTAIRKPRLLGVFARQNHVK